MAQINAIILNQQFHAALDPLLGKINNVATVPQGINIVSVKVMPNGDLNLYFAQP